MSSKFSLVLQKLFWFDHLIFIHCGMKNSQSKQQIKGYFSSSNNIFLTTITQSNPLLNIPRKFFFYFFSLRASNNLFLLPNILSSRFNETPTRNEASILFSTTIPWISSSSWFTSSGASLKNISVPAARGWVARIFKKYSPFSSLVFFFFFFHKILFVEKYFNKENIR